MNTTLVIGEHPERVRSLVQWLGIYGVDAIPCHRERELAASCLSTYDVSSVLLWVDQTPQSSQFFDTLRELTQVPILAMGVKKDLDTPVAYLDRGAVDCIPSSMSVEAIAERILRFEPVAGSQWSETPS